MMDQDPIQIRESNLRKTQNNNQLSIQEVKSRDYEKELKDLKIEYIKFLKESNELESRFRKEVNDVRLK